MLTRVIGPIVAGGVGIPSRFPAGYGLISYSYRYLTSPSNGVYPRRPRWGQSIIRRGVSVGVVDSRGSEPWVLGGHGYERASWVMVLHQSGLICRGVLAFLFRLAVVPYPTSVGFVRVVLCILSHPYCISVQSSIYPLRPCSRLSSWWYHPSVDSI